MSDRIITQSIGDEIITSIKIADGSITADKIAANTISITNLSPAIAAQSAGIKITNIVYLSGLSVAGTTGEFCNLLGSGFYNGAVVFVANYQCLTYYISSTGLQFKVPTLTPGTYWVYVKNTDGATAFKPNAIVISTTPVWVGPTAGLLGTVNSQNFLGYNFVAESDSPVSYTLESGTLPSGLTLLTSGNLSGTIPATAVASSPFYFTIRATDVEGQTASRSYILAVQGSVGITSITYPNNQNAASTLGGETVIIQGTGFLSGATVRIGNQSPVSALVSNSTFLTFTTSSGSIGTFGLAVTNINGTFGNIANFYRYSSVPVWSGNTNLPNIEPNVFYSANIYSFASVTSDSSVVSRIITSVNLPIGITADGNTGIVSGYTTINSNVAYGLTVTAYDSEGQSSSRSFTANIQIAPDINLNTDAYSMVDGGTYTLIGNNFSNTATVYFNNTAASTTRISSNRLDFQAPFIQHGTYQVYVQQGNIQVSNPISWLVGETTVGQVAFTTPGTYSWTAPFTSNVSVVAVGGGGSGTNQPSLAVYNRNFRGGGGGGLAWVNSIPVVPGKNYTVVVGAGGYYIKIGPNNYAQQLAGDSYFINVNTVRGGAGSSSVENGVGGGGGTFTASNAYGTFGGGIGGSGGNWSSTYGGGGGGGAGGYSGKGGDGQAAGILGTYVDYATYSSNFAASGQGGGGGGGAATSDIGLSPNSGTGGAGGGVGLFGEGTSGQGGNNQRQGSQNNFYARNKGGAGGSNGSTGGDGASSDGSSNLYPSPGAGGAYGGGGGGGWGFSLSAPNEIGSYGGGGAVRIIYGNNRLFPALNTQDLTTLTLANASGYLGQATINSFYSKIFAATIQAGTAVTWSVVNGSLPLGLSLTSTGTNTAVLSGTIIGNADVYNFAVRATDSIQQRVTGFYSILVVSP